MRSRPANPASGCRIAIFTFSSNHVQNMDFVLPNRERTIIFATMYLILRSVIRSIVPRQTNDSRDHLGPDPVRNVETSGSPHFIVKTSATRTPRQRATLARSVQGGFVPVFGPRHRLRSEIKPEYFRLVRAFSNSTKLDVNRGRHFDLLISKVGMPFEINRSVYACDHAVRRCPTGLLEHLSQNDGPIDQSGVRRFGSFTVPIVAKRADAEQFVNQQVPGMIRANSAPE